MIPCSATLQGEGKAHKMCADELESALEQAEREAVGQGGAEITSEMVSAAIRDCGHIESRAERVFLIRDHLNRALAANKPVAPHPEASTQELRTVLERVALLETVCKLALDEMCRTVAPRDSFTDVVDK